MKVRRLLEITLALFSMTCVAGESNMNEAKTYCVGRYVVDVPTNAELYAQMGEYMYGLVASTRSIPDLPSFQEKMKNREAAFKAGKDKEKYSLDHAIHPSPSSALFEISRTLFGSPNVGAEIYKWDKGITFYFRSVSFLPRDYPAIVENIQKRYIPSLRSRSVDDIPTQNGFCVRDGFFADEGRTPQHEVASISFRFPSTPGLVVHISTTTEEPDSKSLLNRVDSGAVPSGFQSLVSGIRTLRRGEHDVNGRKGEEGLWSLPTDSGFRAYQFKWQAQGNHLQPLKPTLTVELTTRDDQRPNLSDEQLTNLFDAIVNSVRLRPTSGAAKVSDTEVSPVPLNTIVRTGATCPRSGWWTCPEANGLPIAGGSRQYFEMGTTMPSVEVLNQSGILDRLLGRKVNHHVPTTWTLVAIDDVAPPGPANPGNKAD
ncbi:T6SS immunity protein Tli4 family protein [Burkholderia sp. BCC1993]|uniref:T6SS immunity protein Tli4 family protein n=1 Tax=Burkholderia sp. BCC1993 TaxID=2817444 RepID=UPI002AB27169|nr:T6SS immunity protein Tli4 family protein [Burkholderia sp. BCC1993]